MRTTKHVHIYHTASNNTVKQEFFLTIKRKVSKKNDVQQYKRLLANEDSVHALSETNEVLIKNNEMLLISNCSYKLEVKRFPSFNEPTFKQKYIFESAQGAVSFVTDGLLADFSFGMCSITVLKKERKIRISIWENAKIDIT